MTNPLHELETPEAALLRTLIYANMEKRRQGPEPFEARLAHDPDDSDAYLLQGMARCALGQYEQSLDSFAQTLALTPTDPHIYAGQGHARAGTPRVPSKHRGQRPYNDAGNLLDQPSSTLSFGSDRLGATEEGQ